MFQVLMGYFSVLMIATIFYVWRDATLHRSRRRQTTNERVAYMLWVAANRPTA